MQVRGHHEIAVFRELIQGQENGFATDPNGR